ncbi:TPA: hypothetical protein LA460_000244 [Clostridium botulinum]|nr:hypothetical protein [Clostridium botulinum]HBJ1652848.1 hypothetical protein [Clostridium botulinum]
MRDELKRKDDEQFIEYCARLYSSKIELGLNNKEIYEVIKKETNTESAESTVRCNAQLWNKACEYTIEKIADKDDNEELKELETKRLEIEKERIKLRTEKIEYNRNLRKDSRFELFYENIRDSKDRLSLPKFEYLEENEELNSGYILSIADLHYGATFKSENNIYNREEVKRRLEILLEKTKKIIKKNSINKLTVIELADTIQGMIRISDTTLNDIPVVDSVVEISRLIAIFLNELSKYVYIQYRHVLSSNHGQQRYLNTKANEMPHEDMERIIGNYIKDLVSNNNRIKVELSKNDYDSFSICGQNILALHGWQVKNIENSIKDYSMLHRKFYDICFLAHFHAGKSISVGESNGDTKVVVCSGFIGSDPYSDKLKKGTKGKCELFKIEEGCGITETYTIILN